MAQGKKGEKPQKKKKVPGWSIEEMKERFNFAVKEDTEEMRRWRSLNQSEMDLCWKKFRPRTWRRKSWTSTMSKRAREGPRNAEVTPGNGEQYARTRDIK